MATMAARAHMFLPMEDAMSGGIGTAGRGIVTTTAGNHGEL